MGKTHFNQICEFHNTFGLPVSEKYDPDIFSKKPDLINFRCALIKEEIGETVTAVKSYCNSKNQEDAVEIVDGLADTLYVAFGMAASLGFRGIEELIQRRSQNPTSNCFQTIENMYFHPNGTRKPFHLLNLTELVEVTNILETYYRRLVQA